MNTYKVKKGDSWWRIAKNNNMSMKELMELNNANEKTIIHPGQEIKLRKKVQIIPQGIDNVVGVQDNTRVQKSANVPITKLNWVEQAQAYRLANPTTVLLTPEQSYLTNYWAFTGNTPVEEFSYQVMQNAKKDMQDAEKTVKSEKVKHTLYKGDPARTKQEGDKKDLIANLQRQLKQLGYYTKTVDGIEGNGTRNALAAAEKDGYILLNGKLAKSLTQTVNEIEMLPGLAGTDYEVVTLGKYYMDNPEKLNGIKEGVRKLTPRLYTAAQNTAIDLVKAPIKRGISTVLGDKVANFIVPLSVFDENSLSDEVYTWLLDAIDKKWNPEERKKYFEKNPDATVHKNWAGRIKNTNLKESDYQKYYSTPYTGPMQYGFKETMFGKGLPLAQGTLGSFDIVYTKDGAYVKDTWDFGTGNDFDRSTVMGVIRDLAEKYGSLENSNLESTRALNALIKYR